MAENAKRQSKKYDEAIYYKNFVDMINKIMDENEKKIKECSLRPLAVANAFFNGRYAEQNGRSYLVDC